MNGTFAPLKVQSLKEACIARLEELILSGELKIGERLPPERDFAARIGVSRPVLHEALVDLDAKGLVRIAPRHGVFVSDYRRSGSLAILSSLLAYHDEKMDPAFIQSLIDMRRVVETETARLAAVRRSQEQLVELQTLLEDEADAAGRDPQLLTDLDFSFHLSVAIASGNLVYPLIINSFKSVYTSLTGEFFRKYFGSSIVETVHQFHVQSVEAIVRQDSDAAVSTMIAMLAHGETYLKGEHS
jgi:GntR family transcriptional regulator, transcriptional repressor for pyruvate dehydrogenase complex